MKKLGINEELLLQKHIRRGIIDVKGVVFANVLLAITILILITVGIWYYLPEKYDWLGMLWFAWGIFGASISHTVKLNGIKELITSLPTHICTRIAAYVISSIYWLFAKVFIKGA